VGAVVGAVDDDRVVGEAQVIEVVEQLAHHVVVVDHRVVVVRLPPPGLAPTLGLGVGPEVHVGGVEPHEERLLGLLRLADEPPGVHQRLVIDGLHALAGERPGVFDPTVGIAVDHAARPEVRREVREVFGRRIVLVLGLLLGVQVVEVAEELIEPMVGGQELVAVAQVVLAELAGAVPVVLERRGDGGVLGSDADVGAGHAHLGEAGAVRVLPGDEGGPTGGAALLAVVVGEAHPLLGDAVDVGRAIAHHPVRVAAQVRDADVVAPDDQDVRLLVSHSSPPRSPARARLHPLWGPEHRTAGATVDSPATG
jgi:hypothetical protein